MHLFDEIILNLLVWMCSVNVYNVCTMFRGLEAVMTFIGKKLMRKKEEEK